MANNQKINPYNKLLSEAKSFIYELRGRKEITMYSGMKKDVSYDFASIYERVMAAEQLGYEVLITKDLKDECYKIVYRKKFPEIPFIFRY